MATDDDDPDQPEQPGAATESAGDPSAGGSAWFSLDPSPDRLAWSADDRQVPGPTAPPGPDLIYAGMVHVDPEPGIDAPAGAGRPNIPAGERPDPRNQDPEDRAGGSGWPGEPAEGGDTREGSRRDPVAAGPEMARRAEGRAGASPETIQRGPGRPGGDPVEQGAGRGWLAARRPGAGSGEADAEQSRDSEAQDSPTRTGDPAGLVDAPPDAATSEAPQRSGDAVHDTDGFRRGPERRSDSGGGSSPGGGSAAPARRPQPARPGDHRGGRGSENGLDVVARAADRPAVDSVPEAGVGTGVGTERESGWGATPEVGTGTGWESGRDGEPAPWTEPALPMPWPAPAKAPVGEGTEGVAADDKQEQPPAPDPRWPRLFAVGLGTAAIHLERGGDLQPHQRAADRGTPATGPEPSGDQPSISVAPRHRDQPGGGGEDAGTAVDTVPAGTLPEAQTRSVTQPVAGEHDGPGRAGSGPPHGHGAGVVSTEAAADEQVVEAPAPAIVGPAKTEQMASRPPTSASGAPSRAHASMAPAGLSNPSVSPETEGGGGVVKQRPDDPSIEEDEAAIAVREAVSRAAAQAGVDVSRETSPDVLVEPTATTPPGAVVEALGDIPRIDSEAAAKNARVTFRIHTDGANGHGRIVAVANQKGGVGKSTTAVNLGAYLALAGARILVVDLDPQGNASTGLGLDHREIEPSIYDVLTGETPPATAIRATTVANLHVLPSTIDLAGAEVELVSAMSREGRLGRALESIHQYYDTVLVDCPPSLGLLTVNALAAADELLIPIQCEYYALEGLGQLLRNVELVRANLNPELRIGGIVLTMYDGRTRLAEQVVGEVRKHFSELVYQTVVPRSVRLSEAPGYGLPIALYDPLSRGGIAYRDLAFELAERSGLLAPTGEGAI